MFVERVQEIACFHCQLGNDIAEVAGSKVHLHILCHSKLALSLLLETLTAEYFTILVIWRTRSLLIIEIKFPVVTLAAVLVLNVIAISCLEHSQSLELQCRKG